MNNPNLRLRSNVTSALAALVLACAGFVSGRATSPPAASLGEAWGVVPLEANRSPRWPAARAQHLAQHPGCEACGTREDLEVHHKLPFAKYPHLELDPTNLITLCAGRRHCHLRIGHSFNFQSYNPHVQDDASLQLKRIAERKF